MPTEVSQGETPPPETAAADGHGSDRQFWILSAALVVVAFLLRLYTIGRDELWFDEAISAFAVTVADWPQELLRSNTPPLYYLLLWMWTAVAGHSEAALRSLSALSGTLFIVALLLFGRRIIGERAALWSGLVTALAPIQIYYSQEARCYALLLLLLTLSYHSLWRALENNERFWWCATSILALLALYTHYFAPLALAPTALLVWLWPDRERSRQRWLRYAAALFLAGLLFLPWFLWSFYFTDRSWGSINWIKQTWENTRPMLAIPKSLEVFTLGSQYGFTSVINVKRFWALVFPDWLRLTGLLSAGLLGIVAALPWMDHGLGVPWLQKRKTWLWTLLLFPIVALWLISFHRPLYAVGRYEVIAFPAYALLLGLALAKLQRAPKIGPILAHVVALSFFLPVCGKLALYYQAPPRAQVRPTAAAIDKLVRNGDRLVLARSQANLTIYYLTRLGYRWHDGTCENPAAGRRFLCPIYPARGRAAAGARGSLRAEEATQQAARKLVGELRPKDSGLWVLFDRAYLVNGELRVLRPNTFLLEEIERQNLKPVAVTGARGLFRFE
jgi:4-amino-4-deoxy-L-arabinose transferase-like glycosyltransferase